MSRRVVVIGGGIAGLSAAYRIRQLAPELELILVEADARLGGKIRTETVDGLIIDAGPDIVLASKPRALALCRELGLGEQVVPTNPETRRSYVLRAGRLRPIPEGLSGLVPTRLRALLTSRLLSLRGKLRLACEPFLRPRHDDGDESIAAFVRRRFGTEAYRWLYEPLLAGIYAGDGEQLSIRATFPQLRRIEREHGSLLRAVLRARTAVRAEQLSDELSGFVSLRGGMAELTRALAGTLPQNTVRLSTRAVALQPSGGGGFVVNLLPGGGISADAVILAVPAYTAAELLRPLDAQAGAALAAVPYVSSVTISLGYARADVRHPLRGYGYVVPRAERRQALACTWTSSKIEGRAPETWALLRVFVGRAGDADPTVLDDAELERIARAELEQTLGVTAAPRVVRVFRWPAGMPQYTLGHVERAELARVRLARFSGLLLAGSALDGIGIPDCVASAEAAAEQALAGLRRSSSAARVMQGTKPGG